MALSLSSADLAHLSRAIQVLVSPLDHEHVDGWRSAVNRELKELLGADSAGFLLPFSDGLMMYSEEHDPKELNRYPDVVAPDMADGTPMWAQMVRSRVDTLANMYGRHYDRYLGSAYHNEYAGANGAHDPLLATISLGGEDARSMASLHLWHAQPQGRLFGEREVALLRLLFPAFRAGVETQMRWGRERTDLLHTLDGLGQCALVCDPAGRVLHVTPALEETLAGEPEAPLLRREMLAVARALRGFIADRAGEGGRVPGRLAREVRTQRARFQVAGCLYGGPPAGASPVSVVHLERFAPALLSDEDLRAKFALTRAEARVAALLGKGKSNEEIAKELFISPHTARRHTEHVMQKLSVRSRSEVAAKLYG